MTPEKLEEYRAARERNPKEFDEVILRFRAESAAQAQSLFDLGATGAANIMANQANKWIYIIDKLGIKDSK